MALGWTLCKWSNNTVLHITTKYPVHMSQSHIWLRPQNTNVIPQIHPSSLILSYTQIKYRSSYRGPICTPYWIYLKRFLVSWKMSSDVIWTYEFNLNRKLWEWKDRLLGQSISILYDGRGNDINDKSDIFPPFTRKESQSEI